MKVAIVLNRDAGTLIALGPAHVEAVVRAAFVGRGHEVDSEIAAAPAVEAAVTAARDRGADVVMIGGGDGTIRTAAALLAGTATALGVLPLGTMNLIARDLGIPLILEEAAAALAAGRIGEIDVAEVNGEVFLFQSVLGVVPQLSLARERFRGRPWYLRWPGILTLFLSVLIKTRRLSVTLDRGFGPERIRIVSLSVSNNSIEEGFARLPWRTALTHGNLEVTLLKCRSGWGFVWTAVLALLGRSRSHRQVEAHPLPDLTVSAPHRSIKVANDGEVRKLKTPLHYTVRPRALRVLLPAANASDPQTAA